MHESVLLNESILSLNIKPNSIYVDCTLGYGGHSKEILKQLTTGKLYCFDQDSEAIEYSSTFLQKYGTNYELINSNFCNLKEELISRGVTKVDGILFDLGVSSPQLDNQERGFSYHKDAMLDMRMDKNGLVTAKDIVNNYSEQQLAQIIFKYGDEKFSKSIAKNIVKMRQIKEINTTFELVDIIKMSMPQKAMRDSHPARKTFQAIRIEVNKELEILEKSIKDAISMLKKDGIISIITFHSLEDKIVKKVYKEYSEIDEKVKGFPIIPDEYLPQLELINKKVMVPSDNELDNNNRSRSAKLRIAKKIKE